MAPDLRGWVVGLSGEWHYIGRKAGAETPVQVRGPVPEYEVKGQAKKAQHRVDRVCSAIQP